MHITLKSIKRNLGFKGIEVQDLVMGIPIAFLFIIFFAFTSYKIFGLVIGMIGIFLMLPIRVSQKNRMYKVFIMIFKYMFRIREYIYTSENLEKRKVVKLNEIKRKIETIG